MLPPNAISITVIGGTLWNADGTYYSPTVYGGTLQYQVVSAPTGVSLPGTARPSDCATVTVADQRYYLHGNTFYARVSTNGLERFVVVTKPAGVRMIDALPANLEAVPVGRLTYFRAGARYYLPYLSASGEELFVVLDAPDRALAGASASAKPAEG